MDAGPTILYAYILEMASIFNSLQGGPNNGSGSADPVPTGNMGNMGNMGGMEGAPIEAKMPPMPAVATRTPAAKRPSSLGKKPQMGPSSRLGAPKAGKTGFLAKLGNAGKTKKVKLGGLLGAPVMRNQNQGKGNSEVMATLKSLGNTIMERLDRIEKLVAQNGVADTSATLDVAAPMIAAMPRAPAQSFNASGEPPPPMAELTEMAGGRRRGTKRRGRGRA